MMIHGHGRPCRESGSAVWHDRNIEDACPVCKSSGVVAEVQGEKSSFIYHVGPKKGTCGPVCLRVKKILLLDDKDRKGKTPQKEGKHAESRQRSALRGQNNFVIRNKHDTVQTIIILKRIILRESSQIS